MKTDYKRRNNMKKNDYRNIKTYSLYEDKDDKIIINDNINNIRSNMEDILSNEKSKKKAIKYVINLGKNFRNINNSKSPKARSNYKSIEYIPYSQASFGKKNNINNSEEKYDNDKYYNNINNDLFEEMRYKIEDQKNEIRNLQKIIYNKDIDINELLEIL